jgi:hypothetical protein
MSVPCCYTHGVPSRPGPAPSPCGGDHELTLSSGSPLVYWSALCTLYVLHYVPSPCCPMTHLHISHQRKSSTADILPWTPSIPYIPLLHYSHLHLSYPQIPDPARLCWSHPIHLLALPLLFLGFPFFVSKRSFYNQNDYDCLALG